MGKKFLTNAEMAALESQGHAVSVKHTLSDDDMAKLEAQSKPQDPSETAIDKGTTSGPQSDRMSNMQMGMNDKGESLPMMGGMLGSLTPIPGGATMGAAAGSALKQALVDRPGSLIQGVRDTVTNGVLPDVGGAVLGKVGDGLGKFAEGRASAAFDTSPSVGRDLLDSGAVNPLQRKSSVMQKIGDQMQPYAEGKAQMLASDPSEYNLNDLAQNVRNKIKPGQSPTDASSVGKVFDEADGAASMAGGDVNPDGATANAQDVSRIQKTMGNLAKFNKPTFASGGDKMASEGFRDAYGVYGDALESNNPGLSGLNDTLSGLRTAQDNIGSRINPASSLSVEGAVKAGLNKGNEVMAIGTDVLSKVLKANPQILGRYAGVLGQAQQRSPEALAATNHVLQMSDPEYRQLSQSLQSHDQR